MKIQFLYKVCHYKITSLLPVLPGFVEGWVDEGNGEDIKEGLAFR